MKILSLLCALFLVAVTVRADDPVYPVFRERITDLSSTLSSSDKNALEGKLADFERATSNQIAVLIIPSLGGESIEDYSMHVAEKNKLGKKGRDNGILMVIAKDDHKMRIEVGYGLEGALPDAICTQIIRKIVGPQFKQGNYAGGISDGVDAMMAATKGEFKGDEEHGGKRRNTGLGTIIIFLIIASLVLSVLRRMGGGGRSTGGPGGFVTGMLLGNMLGGGFGGGRGGDSGGGFGGFSGGGGGFGGGGASGDW